MTNLSNDVGETLRRLRTDRELSLAGVAQQAGISVATLSRVETNKQNLDVGLLMTLARILGVPAGEILGNGGDGNDHDALARRLGALRMPDRTKVFLQSSPKRHGQKDLQATIEDLLSTVDILRDELEAVQRAVRTRRKR